MTNKEVQEYVSEGRVYATANLYDDCGKNLCYNYYQNTSTEHRGTGRNSWIKNGFYDDNPNCLLELYRRSGKHNSAINIKSSLICGGKLNYKPLEEICVYDDLENLTFQPVQLSENQIIDLARRFEKEKGIMQYKRKASHSLALYGGYFAFRDYMATGEGVRNDNGTLSLTTKLRKTWIEDFKNMRLSSDRRFKDGEYGSVRHFLSDDFSLCRGQRAVSYASFRKNQGRDGHKGTFTAIRADDYDPVTFKSTGLRSQFVGRVTEYRDHYATPDYETLDFINDVEADFEMSEFRRGNVKNGFALDYIIVKYRKRDKDPNVERKKQENDKEYWRNHLKGGKSSRMLLTWAEPIINDDGTLIYPEPYKIIEIPHDTNPERFEVDRKEIKRSILSGHKIISPELIGLEKETGSGFSSQAEYLIASQELLYNHCKNEYQDLLVEDLQKLYLASGIPVEISIEKDLTNFRVMSEEMMKMVLSIDEIRDRFNIQAMSNEISQEVMNRITAKERRNVV